MMADVADQLYAQQQVMMGQLANLSGDVKALTARMDTQLGHGSRRMDDHEQRLRALEAALPDGAEPRLAALEASAHRRTGRVSMLQLILSVVLTLAGSSTAAAILTYLLTRHH